MEYLNEIVLGAVIIFLFVLNIVDRKRAHNREKDYLNRIMAQKGGEEFRDYVQGTTRLDPSIRSNKIKPPVIKEKETVAKILKEKGLSVR